MLTMGFALPGVMVLRRGGFRASFARTVAHDAAAGTLGQISISGAKGPVSLVGAAVTNAPGSAGGRFTLTVSGQTFSVTFDRAGLGTGFVAGQSVETFRDIQLTDGRATIPVRLRVTVRRPLAPPQLIGTIPDQTTQI